MTVRRIELLSTVLLAPSTLATAWSAYQSRQWTGVQAQATSAATAGRISENRAAALANRQLETLGARTAVLSLGSVLFVVTVVWPPSPFG